LFQNVPAGAPARSLKNRGESPGEHGDDFVKGLQCSSVSTGFPPGGEMIIADKDQSTDYYWAARGAGPGFFGVATRYWPLPRVLTEGFVRCKGVGRSPEQRFDCLASFEVNADFPVSEKDQRDKTFGNQHTCKSETVQDFLAFCKVLRQINCRASAENQVYSPIRSVSRLARHVRLSRSRSNVMTNLHGVLKSYGNTSKS
jgi:hypothetical protein